MRWAAKFDFVHHEYYGLYSWAVVAFARSLMRDSMLQLGWKKVVLKRKDAR